MSDRSRVLGWARPLLFILTGLAVPLYAFPIAKILGKPIDLATILAGLFVLTSLPLAIGALRPAHSVFLAGCVFIPLLVLLPPRSPLFSLRAFAFSYAHWLLVVGFFVSALGLYLPENARKRLLKANVIAGTGVALFALYQVVGIPRRWPATGSVLVEFQREPLRFDSSLGYTRPTSIFLEPSWMGGYLVWVLVLSLGLLLMLRQDSRLVCLAASATLIAAILASVSWGAYVDLFAVTIVMAVAALKLRLLSRRLVAAGSGLLALLLIIGGLSSPGHRAFEAVLSRWNLLTTTSLSAEEPQAHYQDSTRIRFQNARYILSLALRHPLRGVGLGQYAAYAKAEGKPWSKNLREPWCGWLSIAAEIGFGGPLLLLLALLLVLLPRIGQAPALVGWFATPALVALAAVEQVHTASYIDLWWWYPLSVAAGLWSGSELPPNRGIV